MTGLRRAGHPRCASHPVEPACLPASHSCEADFGYRARGPLSPRCQSVPIRLEWRRRPRSAHRRRMRLLVGHPCPQSRRPAAAQVRHGTSGIHPCPGLPQSPAMMPANKFGPRRLPGQDFIGESPAARPTSIEEIFVNPDAVDQVTSGTISGRFAPSREGRRHYFLADRVTASIGGGSCLAMSVRAPW